MRLEAIGRRHAIGSFDVVHDFALAWWRGLYVRVRT